MKTSGPCLVCGESVAFFPEPIDVFVLKGRGNDDRFRVGHRRAVTIRRDARRASLLCVHSTRYEESRLIGIAHRACFGGADTISFEVVGSSQMPLCTIVHCARGAVVKELQGRRTPVININARRRAERRRTIASLGGMMKARRATKA